MYKIIFRNDRTRFVTIANDLQTLEQAKARREMSGDLVVDQKNRIVKDQSWLFEWEKKDPDCYAQRAIRLSESKG